MNPRAIFPTIMFVLAGTSFAYGVWQHFAARQVQAAADSRLAFVMQTIAHAPISTAQEQSLYAAIFTGLPKAPSLFGIDLSGSFAAPQSGDSCQSEGQRSVCRAMLSAGSDVQTFRAVCGQCNPR